MTVNPKTNYINNDNTFEGNPCIKCNNIIRYKLNNACVYCVSQRSKKYYEGVKDTEEYKTKLYNNLKQYRSSEEGKSKTKEFNSRSKESRQKEWIKTKDVVYIKSIKRKYNLTNEEYEKLLISQNNKCKICNQESSNKRLVVDHCHISNKVRGLLCFKCNSGLGMFGDDKQLLEQALLYIEKNGE